MLSKEEILKGLDTIYLGRNIVLLDEVDSTNTYLRSLADKGAPTGTLVTAESQSAGKGRRGRTWVSPKGSNIYMSLLIRPKFTPEKARMLTLIMALAVAKAINKVTGLSANIKWPNDIVINNKKVTGILTEMIFRGNVNPYVIIGTGINVNIEEFPDDIKDMASSLKLESGKYEIREDIISSTINFFEKYYEKFLINENLSQLKCEYELLLVNKDKEVKVLGEKEPYTAIALGIDNEGELLVRKNNGAVEKIYAGEVTVRGLYGYV